MNELRPGKWEKVAAMVPGQIQSDTLTYCEHCYTVELLAIAQLWPYILCNNMQKKNLPDISGKFRNLEILITCMLIQESRWN